MKEFNLENEAKIIYKQVPGAMTSFCIGFEAGANSEEGFNFGVAHALEHMLYKGTKSKSEREINLELDRIFAFNNAMTNYPYVIFYGSCSSEDFKDGFELISDILINPKFSEEGFKEEMDVILQECKEWKEDFTQYCEDELFLNSYKNKRISEMIIGNEESIKGITLEELKRFYDTYYVGGNCVITVVSSLDLGEVQGVLKEFNLRKNPKKQVVIPKETNKSGKYEKKVLGFNGGKIQYIYDIQGLEKKELEALSIYSMYLGEGMSSALFEEVRNKKGYAYDISSTLKVEKGIEVFTINTGTSKEKIKDVIESIDEVLQKSIEDIEKMTKEEVESLKRRLSLKREFWSERSVELAKHITTNEVMFGNGVDYVKFRENIQPVEKEDILETVKRVIKNPSVQVLS